METKKCTKCGEIKPLSDFHKHINFKDGHAYWCKDCCSQYAKKYSQENKVKIKLRSKKYRDDPINKIKRKEYIKDYGLKNRVKIGEQQRNWQDKNRSLVRKLARDNNRIRLTNHAYRIGNNVSRSIRYALQDGKEGNHWESIVGYTVKELTKHLESKFQEGMNWENYGKNGWTIDHIIPISWWKFESYNDREFKQCWCLANLQPLWAHDNFSKRNRYAG